jgi:hypothetical protein
MKNDQYLKSLLSICVLFNIFFFTSCGSKRLFESDSHEYYNSSNLNNDTMLVTSIPNEFVCFGNIYTINHEEVESLKFKKMIGYLINEKELDYWKNVDNNKDIVYALDMGNGIYRYTYENDMNNRFELYAQDEAYDCLAIKSPSNNDKLMLYNRQGEKL